MSKERYITAQIYYSTEYVAYLYVSELSGLETLAKILKFITKYRGHIINVLNKEEFLEMIDVNFYGKKWQDEIKEEKFNL